MGLYLRELYRSFHRYTTYWLLMLIVLVLSILLVSILVTDVQSSWGTKKTFDAGMTGKTIVYTLFDNIKETTHQIQERPETLANYELFRQAMKTVPGIRTYEAKTFQWPIEKDWPELPDAFIVGYSDGYIASSPGMAANYRPVNVLMISDNFLAEYGIGLSEGRYMSQDSYRFETGKAVDTLLGAAFRQYFKIGDKMTIKSINNIELVVVGFLEPDAIYPEQSGRVKLMDHLVLIPGFTSFGEVKNSKGLFASQFIFQLGAPIVVVEDPDIDVFELVNAMAARFDILPLNIIQIEYANIDILKSVSGQQIYLTTLLALLVLVVNIATLAILISSKMRGNLKTYSIYLLTGGSPWQILRMMMSETFVLLVCAVIIAVISHMLIYTMGFSVYFQRIYLMIFIALIGITLGVSLFQLRKLKLAELIRRVHT